MMTEGERASERKKERANSPLSLPPSPFSTHLPKHHHHQQKKKNIQRLAATLLHEMCHVAAWTLDAQARPPHGARFQAWAARAARALPAVPCVRTCHSYRVHAPHAWRCAGSAGSEGAGTGAGAGTSRDLGPRAGAEGCGQVYRRHSRSIDVARHACGVCKGKLVYEGKLGPDGRPLAAGSKAGAGAAEGRGPRHQQNDVAPTPTNAFAAFVAERFARVKRQAPRGTSHGEVMRGLAAEWRAEKEARRARGEGATR